jgi:hypothetical protein
MATVATVQANGPGPEHHIDRAGVAAAAASTMAPALLPARATTPSAQSTGSVKRKRDDDADDDADADEEKPALKDGVDAVKVAVGPTATADPADVVEIPQQDKTIIAGFYKFLRRYTF